MSKYILSTYSRINLDFTHGLGSWLYTKNKKRYLDFTAGIAVNLLGHSNPILIKALKKQASKVWHTSNLYNIKEQEKLARSLCENSFASKVFFCNSGAEATDGLIKIMRKYHYNKGNKRKTKIIVFNNAFHGRTLTGILAGSSDAHREGFLPHKNTNGGFLRAKFNDIKDVKRIINDETAGVFIETIQGEGGINLAKADFLIELRKICKEKNILLGLDEVQCGIGRTGKIFAYEWSKIKPDILTSAKGLGGGFPIGAILLNSKVASCIKPGSHGSTFGGNQLACAVSLAVLKEVSKKKFLTNVIKKGNFLKEELNKLSFVYPKKIKEISGKGLMLGIRCVTSNTQLNEKIRQKGLLLVPAANNVIRILPPLNVKKKEINYAINIIRSSLEEVS